MPSGSDVTGTMAGNNIPDLRAIAAGAISGAILLVLPKCRITVHPGAGATVKVFKSSSPHSLINADAAAGRLSYANFNSGDLSTLSSNWLLWASGATTAAISEGTMDGAGWTGVIAISTGGSMSNVEIVQTP